MNVDNDLIRTIQLVDLDALKEFKALCDAHNIKFYLRGGSVLGAVKYKGFIPWDDDLDVAITRPGYDYLVNNLCGKVIAGKYLINSYKTSDVPCYFPKMVLLEEERKKIGIQKNTKFGLHIMDIFPLDGAPNNWLLRKVYYTKMYYYRTLASLKTVYDDDVVNMHNKLQQFVIDTLKKVGVDKKISQKEIFDLLDNMYRKYDPRKQDYCGTITASLMTKEIIPSRIWGDGTLLQFEDLEMFVPKEYDEYCKLLYGENYAEYEPNLSERKSHLNIGR